MKINIQDLINSPKFKTISLSIGGALVFYALLGFLILPAVISSQAPKIVKQKFNRELSISNIQFNPFSLELSIADFNVKNLDNSDFFAFKRLYINIAVLQSIIDLTLSIDQVLLQQPSALIKRNNKGLFNFTDMLDSGVAEPEEKPTDDSIFPLNIAQIAITNGNLTWEDHLYANSQHEVIKPLNLTINNFTTIINEQSQLGFSLQLASGGALDWQGNIKLNPFQSTGHIKLDKINFHKIWQLFLQDSVNFNILSGTELIESDYSLSDTEDGMQLLLNKAHIDLIDLKLSEKGNSEALISIPDFKISDISFNLLNRTIDISSISANDAHFKAWLNTDGSINYQALFATNNSESPAATQAADKQEPWTVSVKKLALNNLSFDFTDKSLATPAQLNISALTFNATELNNQPGTTLPFDLTLHLNQSGRINISGQSVLEPFSSHTNITLGTIAINDFQPYIDQFVRLDIMSGFLNLTGDISVSQQEDENLKIGFKGDSHIDDFISRDQISNKDLLNWKQLSLESIDIDVAANRYTIDTVTLDKLYSNILIREDKSLNLSDIAIPSKKDASANTAKKYSSKSSNNTKQASKAFFKIANFNITNGSSDFADKSLILPFLAHITDLKGTIKGISLEQDALINIALNGRVSNFSPVVIKGRISPFKGDSDINLDFKSMPLPFVTPYMAEFAGRKIEKGNMSLGLRYQIIDKQLTASNNLLIDQLVLGDEVENPDAISLPLELAIALLQDSDGKITLAVPITGDLDHPEFSVTHIIIDALVNVITKIITSPFDAIASLIGSDEDISKIMFLSGQSNLDIKQQEKLDALVSVLSERPALKLEIKGSAYSEDDWPQLQEEALDNQLLEIWADQLNKDNDKKTLLPEQLIHTEKKYQQLLADLFIEKFPHLGERSLFGTPQLINQESADFYNIAQAKLANVIPPNTHRLRQLAVERAQVIANYLVDKKIAIDRIFLLDTIIDPESQEQEIATTLSLTVD